MVVLFVHGMGRSPDTLDAAAIQTYLLHLITEKKLAYACVNQAACAFRFLFGTVLAREAARFDIPVAKAPKRLPVVLSREDIGRLFADCGNPRMRNGQEAHRIGIVVFDFIRKLQANDYTRDPIMSIANEWTRRMLTEWLALAVTRISCHSIESE